MLWLVNAIRLELVQPNSALGADPGEAVVHFLGEWSLRILLLAFSVTPLFKLTRQPWIMQNRRLIGLWAFSYVCLHLSAYLYFFLQWSWPAFVEDLTERPYIIAGMAAFICLIPMTVTSTRGWRVRLGPLWKKLHRLIYPAVGLAIVHLFWLTRDQYLEVVIYALWFLVLVGWRLRDARVQLPVR